MKRCPTCFNMIAFCVCAERQARSEQWTLAPGDVITAFAKAYRRRHDDHYQRLFEEGAVHVINADGEPIHPPSFRFDFEYRAPDEERLQYPDAIETTAIHVGEIEYKRPNKTGE